MSVPSLAIAAGDPESMWNFQLMIPSPARQFLGTNMTGRPGNRTIEMNGRSTASYFARTLCVPVFLLIYAGLEANGAFRLPGAMWENLRCRWNLRPVIFGVEILSFGPRCKLLHVTMWMQHRGRAYGKAAQAAASGTSRARLSSVFSDLQTHPDLHSPGLSRSKWQRSNTHPNV